MHSFESSEGNSETRLSKSSETVFIMCKRFKSKYAFFYFLIKLGLVYQFEFFRFIFEIVF